MKSEYTVFFHGRSSTSFLQRKMATTLETHTSTRTQPVRRYKPELGETLFKPTIIAWL